MPSVTDFIQANARPLADLVRQRMVPLHDPACDDVHRMIPRLLRSPKGPQGHIVTAASKAMRRQRDVVFANAPGTGKTYMSLGAAHCHANGNPYTCVITCPPHLTEKWEREIRMTIPSPMVIHVDTWKEWLVVCNARRSQISQPTFFIAAISKAKLGAKVIPAALYSKRLGGLTCPQCFALLKNGKERMTFQDLQVGKKYCPKCKSALWQYEGKRVSASKLVKERCKIIDYFIADECHTQKSNTTLAGDAMGHLIAASKKVMLLTGTLIAGKSEDLRATYFRLFAKRFKDRGLGWKDEQPFARRYGRMETLITSKAVKSGKVAEEGRKRTHRTIKPGIMPGLFADFLADRTIFLSLKEMGESLPPLTEESIGIDMAPEQAAEYFAMQKTLVSKFLDLMKVDKRIALGFLAGVSEALMTWPDDPSGWPTLGYTDDEGFFRDVYRPVDVQGFFPKEKAVLDMVLAEKELGRQCWVFSTRDDTRSRIHAMLLKNGISCNELRATIKPEVREKWIGDHAPGSDVIISHPKLVETGLDFFSAGHGKHGKPYNMATLIWVSTGMELNTLRQASARHWRIGQTLECKTRFLYYRNTAQQVALNLMARKLLAAEFLEGKLEGAGLIEEVSEASMELAVVRQLAAGVMGEPPSFSTVS